MPGCRITSDSIIMVFDYRGVLTMFGRRGMRWLEALKGGMGGKGGTSGITGGRKPGIGGKLGGRPVERIIY